MLLDHGADVDGFDERGCPPLYVACETGQLGAATLLLDRGADINRRGAGPFGEPPLSAACRNGHVKAAALRLDRGADANRGTRAEGVTSLWLASANNQFGAVRLLLERTWVPI